MYNFWMKCQGNNYVIRNFKEGFHQLGSISMINNITKETITERIKIAGKLLQFILDINSGNGSAKGKKLLISKLHFSMLLHRPET